MDLKDLVAEARLANRDPHSPMRWPRDCARRVPKRSSTYTSKPPSAPQLCSNTGQADRSQRHYSMHTLLRRQAILKNSIRQVLLI